MENFGNVGFLPCCREFPYKGHFGKCDKILEKIRNHLFKITEGCLITEGFLKK